MPDKFQLRNFSETDVNDLFFDSLKEDYPDFTQWYKRKVDAGSKAYVFKDENGLGAFIYLKDENDSIELSDRVLPAAPRLKIGTLKLAEHHHGQRLGEGALGLALWQWQEKRVPEVYITLYEKHTMLVSLIKRFGFNFIGVKNNGESVYIKSRKDVDYSDPYKSFPFIDPTFKKAGYIIVDDLYHDTLFPRSELKNVPYSEVNTAAANGISKVYVGANISPHYCKREPVLIYRKHTKNDGQKPKFKSCLTSYCVVTDIIFIKKYGKFLMTYDKLKDKVGNKSVFDEQDIRNKYNTEKNVVVIQMLYYGYFGEGNNVNYDWLERNGYWADPEVYPTDVRLSPAQFKEILEEGRVDVQNTIID